MSTPILPVSIPETRTASAARDNAVEPAAPPPQPELDPSSSLTAVSAAETGKLLVRFDGESGRFVQTMTDVTSKETLWTYPREAPLSYSRAVMAYLRALSQK